MITRKHFLNSDGWKVMVNLNSHDSAIFDDGKQI